MTHARNIRTEYLNHFKFKNKPIALKILHIYLPMLADREGRLIDEPEEIRENALTHHPELDINHMLNELKSMNFLIRYKIEGLKIIQLLNWNIEQSPHGTERDSRIPDVNGMLTVNARKPQPSNIIIKGQYSLEKYVSVKKRLHNGGLPVRPSLINALIPYPGSLTPDSGSLSTNNLTPDTTEAPPVDNFTAAVCSVFSLKSLPIPNIQDPLFVSLLNTIKDIDFWELGVQTAVDQKKARGLEAEHPYIFGTVRGMWKGRAAKTSPGNVIQLTGNDDRNTVADLSRRASVVGINIQSEYPDWPRLRVQIESLEAIRKVG